MGQKVNSGALRLIKTKNWYNLSHYLPLNYSKNVNKDLQVIKFLKGFLLYFGINHNIINITRFTNQINIVIIIYNRDYLFRYSDGIFKNIKGF